MSSPLCEFAIHSPFDRRQCHNCHRSCIGMRNVLRNTRIASRLLVPVVIVALPVMLLLRSVRTFQALQEQKEVYLRGNVAALAGRLENLVSDLLLYGRPPVPAPRMAKWEETLGPLRAHAIQVIGARDIRFVSESPALEWETDPHLHQGLRNGAGTGDYPEAGAVHGRRSILRSGQSSWRRGHLAFPKRSAKTDRAGLRRRMKMPACSGSWNWLAGQLRPTRPS